MIAVQVQPDNIKVRAATKLMQSHGQGLPDWIRQERIPPPLAGAFIVDLRHTTWGPMAHARLGFGSSHLDESSPSARSPFRTVTPLNLYLRSPGNSWVDD